MRNIKIMCDSLSDLPKEIIEKYDIHVIPLSVNFNDIEYVDGVDISKEEFYKMLRESNDLPKTSQVTYASFKSIFDEYLSKGYKVLYIAGSSSASGTYQSSMMAKNDIENSNLHIFDTMNLSIGSANFVLTAAKMAFDGCDIDEILKNLESMKDNVKVWFTVDTLEYLQKGGRISLAKATIGNMLSIKPILSIEEGLVKQYSQARGKKQVLSKIISIIEENYGKDLSSKRIILGYGDNVEDLNILKEKIEAELNVGEIVCVNIGSCICAHSGPGIVGLACSNNY